MTPEQLNQIEKLISDAIEVRIKNGWRLSGGLFRCTYSMQVCPLGALDYPDPKPGVSEYSIESTDQYNALQYVKANLDFEVDMTELNNLFTDFTEFIDDYIDKDNGILDLDEDEAELDGFRLGARIFNKFKEYFL